MVSHEVADRNDYEKPGRMIPKMETGRNLRGLETEKKTLARNPGSSYRSALPV